MRVGLVGCGAIGSAVAQAILQNRVPGARLAAVAVRRPTETASAIARQAGCPLVSSPEELLEAHPTVVVESAAAGAVETYMIPALEAGVDALILSVGALVDEGLRERLAAAASGRGARVLIPSGAIGGTDVLRAAAAMGTLARVTLSTRKSPAGLQSAPFVIRKGLRLADLTDAEVIFQGSARDAVREFPQNVNVAATISLAGLGFDRTQVRIVADPSTPRTVHELEASGEFGELRLHLANTPHPEQPRTSWLAALSAVAALQGRAAAITVGA